MSVTVPSEKGKQYCAFWYPTIFHHTDAIAPKRSDAIKDIDISDEASASCRLYLDINEDSKGGIGFEMYKKEGSERVVVRKIHLDLEQQSNNGFAVYSNSDTDVDLNEDLFKNVFFHHAKSLRHNHEVNADSDSGLSAMVVIDSEFDPKDIFKHDNCVIQYYLKQYEELFGLHYAEMISDRNMFYDKMIKTFRVIRQNDFTKKFDEMSKENILEFDKDIHTYYNSARFMAGGLQQMPEYKPEIHSKFYYRRLRRKIPKVQRHFYEKYMTQLKGLCENAMMEYTYCQTLLNSKYNTEIRHDVKFTPAEVLSLSNEDTCDMSLKRRDLSRKMANNIQNSIRYIRCIMYKCSNYTDEQVKNELDWADQISQRSIVLSIIFGVVSILSLIVALI